MSRQSQIRERLEKATPGPRYGSAHLIAHAPSDLRYLLDRLEAAEKLVVGATALVELHYPSASWLKEAQFLKESQ